MVFAMQGPPPPVGSSTGYCLTLALRERGGLLTGFLVGFLHALMGGKLLPDVGATGMRWVLNRASFTSYRGAGYCLRWRYGKAWGP